MCGIIGVASQKPISDKQPLTLGNESMSHRGPDNSGLWWSSDDCVGLGHRRLAILDLSTSGHQPMHDESGSLSIVLNGEIYNYKELRYELEKIGYHFNSKSDTEVVLASYRHWGEECLSRFNGMFAFAIYDSKKRRFFIARDRVGEKPLYYYTNNDKLYFSSELKALMANPMFHRRIDIEALDCYLTFGFVPGDMCILKDVKKLPPAHALIFDLNSCSINIWKYWKVPDLEEGNIDSLLGEEELLDELKFLLEDSVRLQLNADVPVGIALSGGIDSSLVTAMAVRSSSKIKTYSIRFPGYGKYDETEHARLIAKVFETEHIELQAEELSVECIPRLARQVDEPIVDSSIIPTYLVSNLIRDHCKVALGGDGGDELFGGYNHYSRLIWLDQAIGWVPKPLRSILAKASANLLPIGFKGRNWLQELNFDFNSELPLTAVYFDYISRKKLYNNMLNNNLVAEKIYYNRIPQVKEIALRSMKMDFENYLPEDILVKIDRASMLNSLEMRAPFLDYRIIEFAFSKVPTFLKATRDSKKILLKKLSSNLLPAEFDLNRKQGFSIPLTHWLSNSGPWESFMQEVLLDNENKIFNKSYIKELINGHKRGLMNSERLFALLFFELWRQEYKAIL